MRRPAMISKREVTIETIEKMRDVFGHAHEVFAQLAAGTYTGTRRDIIAAGDRIKMVIYDVDTVGWWHDDSKGNA